MVRRVARWLVVAAGSALLGLALIAAAIYWHFLHSGPSPSVWHRVALADFTEEQADQVRTLDDYLRLEQGLFDELQERVYGAVPPGGDAATFNCYSAGSRRDPGVWPVNWNRTFHLRPAPGTELRGASRGTEGDEDQGKKVCHRGLACHVLSFPKITISPSLVYSLIP